VTGIDIDSGNIIKAKINQKAAGINNIQFYFQDALLYHPDKVFDVAVLSNVLEHIGERSYFLKSISNMSNKLLIRVPLINRDWITLYKKERGIDFLLDPSHAVEYTIELFRQELKEAGLEIEKETIQFGEIWAVAFK
jgi:hypothetical protein